MKKPQLVQEQIMLMILWIMFLAEVEFPFVMPWKTETILLITLFSQVVKRSKTLHSRMKLLNAFVTSLLLISPCNMWWDPSQNMLSSQSDSLLQVQKGNF